MSDVVDTLEMPLPFGVFADTGRPLPPLAEEDIRRFAKGEPVTTSEKTVLETRAAPSDAVFAVIGEIDPNDLSQAGWGVIYAPGVGDDVKQQLEPLLNHRRSQAGGLFKIFDGADGYQAGETAVKWLARHKSSLNVVDPVLGIPYYLILLGSPQGISF